MRYPYYSLTANKEKTVYEFTSVSDSKVIKKFIIFDLIKGESKVYNFSFGDRTNSNEDFLCINDRIVSNNGDMNRVLATVFRAVLDFTDDKGFYKIYFTGSTPARTRLYRMAISNNYDNLSKYFVIYGLTINGGFVIFKKDTKYFGYMITPI